MTSEEAASAQLQRVPRHTEGGASAPPPADVWIVDPPRLGAHSNIRAFATRELAVTYSQTQCPPHTRYFPASQQWALDRSVPVLQELPDDALSNKIAHYGAQLDADTATAQQTDVPVHTACCDKHGVVYTLNSECGLCFDERTASLHTTNGRTSTTAADFCTEAARLVGGPRAATHGDKTINFQNIAELWNGYWRIKCRLNGERLTTPFTAHDVGCMMELFKIARRFSGSFNADDYIDAAGYAGCTGEIAATLSSRGESVK